VNFSEPFIRRPIARSADAGIATVRSRPTSAAVAALPNVTTEILVTAQLPGADPQTMASTVATALEQQMGQIRRHQLTSTSAWRTRSPCNSSSPQPSKRAVDVLAPSTAVPTCDQHPYRPRSGSDPAERPVLLLASAPTLPLTTSMPMRKHSAAEISQIPAWSGRHRRQAEARDRVQVNPQALGAAHRSRRVRA